MKCHDIEVGLDFEPEPGLADNGDLEQDLPVLLESVGATAAKAGTAVIMFVDELQYVDGTSWPFSSARCIGVPNVNCRLHSSAPVSLNSGDGWVKQSPYAERLFDFPNVGALDGTAAADAIVKPAKAENVDFEGAAVAEITRQTKTYFLQEWGKHAWDCTDQSPSH